MLIWWCVINCDRGVRRESLVGRATIGQALNGLSFRGGCLPNIWVSDELVKQVGTRAELTQATYARFREAAARYGEDAGEMTVCKLIEEDAGVELRVAGDWLAPWQVKHPDENP